MKDAFIAGGWGMYPTLIAGLALLAACVRYASRPESRHVPLMLCLGLFTLLAGALGFITGVMAMLGGVEGPQAEPPRGVLYLGLGESLNNVALALLLTTLSALLASVGVWKVSQSARAVAPAAH
jgi:hypothetical protein